MSARAVSSATTTALTQVSPSGAGRRSAEARRSECSPPSCGDGGRAGWSCTQTQCRRDDRREGQGSQTDCAEDAPVDHLSRLGGSLRHARVFLPRLAPSALAALLRRAGKTVVCFGRGDAGSSALRLDCERESVVTRILGLAPRASRRAAFVKQRTRVEPATRTLTHPWPETERCPVVRHQDHDDHDRCHQDAKPQPSSRVAGGASAARPGAANARRDHRRAVIGPPRDLPSYSGTPHLRSPGGSAHEEPIPGSKPNGGGTCISQQRFARAEATSPRSLGRPRCGRPGRPGRHHRGGVSFGERQARWAWSRSHSAAAGVVTATPDAGATSFTIELRGGPARRSTWRLDHLPRARHAERVAERCAEGRSGRRFRDDIGASSPPPSLIALAAARQVRR